MCAKLSGSDDAKIRTALLGILSRFHQKQLPLVTDAFAVESGYTSIELFDNFSSIFSSLGASLSLFNTEAEAGINTYLFKFCPYFVTKDLFVDKIIHMALKDNFSDSVSIDSESFRDELHILTTKFVFNELDFEKIPKNIYFYLISFLNEVAYGVDSTVPSSCDAWMVETLRISRSHNLQKFWEFMETFSLSKISYDSSELIDLMVFYKNFIENDIEQSPDSEYLKEKFSSMLGNQLYFSDPNIDMLNDLFEKSRKLGLDLPKDLFELYLNSLSRERMVDKLSFSRITKSNSSFARIICSKRITSEKFNDFWTANSINPFNLDKFVMKNPDSDSIGEFLEQFLAIKSPSLAHLDVFSKLVSSEYVTSNQLSSIVAKLNCPWFFEIIINEAKVPLTIFYLDSNNRLSATWRPFLLPVKEVFNRLFDYLMSDDPFILLTIQPIFLEMFQSRIRDKFNLNLRYSFDLTSLEISQLSSIIPLNLSNGQVLSFKEIVNCISIPELKEIFSSTPKEFEDYTTVDWFTRPICISSSTCFTRFSQNSSYF